MRIGTVADQPGDPAPDQPERTALAWQRTAISVLAAGLVMARLAALHDAALVVPVVAVVLPLAAWVLASSRRGYGVRSGRTRDRTLQVGLVGAALAGALAAMCLVELLVITLR